MAWDLIALGTQTDASSGNLALDEPSGVAQGDLIIACIAYRSNAAFTVPDANWTIVATQQSSGDTDATSGIASGLMAYCIRGSSPPGYTFTRTGGDIARGRTIAYRGQATTTPYDTGSATTLAAIGNPSVTGITTAQANELIVLMISHGDSATTTNLDAATSPSVASGSTDTSTEPTSDTWIERQDAGTTTGADVGLFIADAIKPNSGSTGTITATASKTSRSVIILGAWKIKPSRRRVVITHS